MGAEYTEMSLGAKELILLRKINCRLLKIEELSILYEDNRSAISVAKSEDSQSLKHIVNLCYHYIQYEVALGNLKII